MSTRGPPAVVLAEDEGAALEARGAEEDGGPALLERGGALEDPPAEEEDDDDPPLLPVPVLELAGADDASGADVAGWEVAARLEPPAVPEEPPPTWRGSTHTRASRQAIPGGQEPSAPQAGTHRSSSGLHA
ncbi:MAG: hypothetical protein HY904_14630 [Deltaproteobacteria bacterium]|nr:hypothetical protein [Deltaproteobacteria bacterium]